MRSTLSDPVVTTVFAATLAVVLTFVLLPQPRVLARLGGGFVGKVRAKWLAAAGFFAGALLAGAVSGVPLAGFGAGLSDSLAALAWTVGVLAVSIPVVAFTTRQPAAWTHAPELRADRYGAAEVAHLVMCWAAYLFAYELMFRGLLLTQLVEALGTGRGLAVMSGLYVLAHLTKRPAEVISTVLVGPLYGWIALESGGFWPVFLIHVALALTSELGAAHANPDIGFPRRRPDPTR
jgi:membrane protease YdiL (CAAX protease family)